MTKCVCRCHSEPDLCDRAFPFSGVDVCDAVAAVFACQSCKNMHCPALLDTTPLSVRTPQRGVQVTTPDGQQMTWDEYQREMEKRAESWRHQDNGEGAES